MTTLKINTNAELKAVTCNSFGNPHFKFSTSKIKSINGVEIKTYLEVSKKHVTHYVGGGSMETFNAPFIIELKN